MTAQAKPRLRTREEILATDDRSFEYIETPEWGTVRITSLTGADRDAYIKSLYALRSNGKGGMEIDHVNLDGSNARLVAMSVTDDSGARLFSDEDVDALQKKNGAVLDVIYVAAAKLSRLNRTLEEVKADLGAAQNGSSGTA